LLPMVHSSIIVLMTEPGLYFEGKYGIRIENVVKCVSVGKGFLGFRPVTYVPMHAELMEIECMTREEIAWVNAYHQACFDKVSGLLDEKSMGYTYLVDATRPIKQ